MGLFGKNYYDIGRNKSADDFLKAYRKAKKSDKASERGASLLKGAVQAFREGRPANIQELLQNEQELNRTFYNGGLAASILFKVTENSSDKLADIERALSRMTDEKKTETLCKTLTASIHAYSSNDAFLSLILEATKNALAKGSVQEKRNVLSSALNVAISSRAGKNFCSLLLESGADAKAKINGNAEGQLVTAATVNAPEAVVRLLYDNGADFKEAIAALMYSTSYYYGSTKSDYINRLKFYEERIAGNQASAPVTAKAGGDDDLRETIRDLKKQVRDLTEVVGALTKEFRKHNGSAPAEEAPPQEAPARKTKHEYPSL